jgi:hypothetical protein
MVFDPLAIAELLSQVGLPQWGTNRPQLLIWIAIGDQSGRFLLGSDHELALKRLLQRQIDDPFGIDVIESVEAPSPQQSEITGDEVNQAYVDPSDSFHLEKVGTDENLITLLDNLAFERGMPILWPFLDLEDQFALDSADVWSRFVGPIRTASLRYNPDAILTGRIELVQDGWIVDWILLDDVSSEVWQGATKTLSEALSGGLATSIERLASRYAVVQDNAFNQVVRVSITSLDSLQDMAQAENYLRSLAAVNDVKIKRFNNGSAEYELYLAGDVSSLLQSIRLADVLAESNAPVQNYEPMQAARPEMYFEWRGER